MTRILVVLTLCLALPLQAQQLFKQDHPAQFISYWKSAVISAQQDELVSFAQSVFARLLRTWDSSRHEPGLYVVDSEQGAWAVSLVDGNILLSRQAIEACKEFGAQRAQHLLAFILAHELAHQRSDDLWQHRFFRLDREGSVNDPHLPALSHQLDRRMLQDMQQKENRADHDGLVLMSSVGFDPYQIVDKKDFFTQWVENLWQQPCQQQSDAAIREACDEASQRALRTRSQLDTVASQSSLYQLGVQAMVAKQYAQARRYFSQYARDFPSRAVMTALGLSHLVETLELRNELIRSAQIDSVDFYFPLLMDASAGFDEVHSMTPGGKRSLAELDAQQRAELTAHTDKAVAYFEKTIRLAPDYRHSYQLLAIAYVLNDNSFMARGILQGRYIPKFGVDDASSLLLALTTAIEGNSKQAIELLHELSRQMLQRDNKQTPVQDVLLYATFYNLAALLKNDGQSREASAQWEKLARHTRHGGQAYLFSLVLAHLQAQQGQQYSALEVAPTINGLRLGNRKTRDDSSHSINELWIEGDQYHVYNYDSGAQFITGMDGRIISARQSGGQASLGLIATGDKAERCLITLGLPERRLQLVSGEFLAYDQYGLAIQIDDSQVVGWFLY